MTSAAKPPMPGGIKLLNRKAAPAPTAAVGRLSLDEAVAAKKAAAAVPPAKGPSELYAEISEATGGDPAAAAAKIKELLAAGSRDAAALGGMVLRDGIPALHTHGASRRLRPLALPRCLAASPLVALCLPATASRCVRAAVLLHLLLPPLQPLPSSLGGTRLPLPLPACCLPACLLALPHPAPPYIWARRPAGRAGAVGWRGRAASGARGGAGGGCGAGA